jgi:peptidoglycan/xylan/chitin deacetylase (PgdA/CDA1 family)
VGAKRASKIAIASSAGEALRVGALLRRMPVWQGVAAVTYHRVGYSHGTLGDHKSWEATPEAFDDQVRWLARNMDVITPEDLPNLVRGGRGRYVMVTFDDAYREIYDHAFPSLMRHGVRATFFITSGFVDDSRVAWWDEISAMVRLSTRTRLVGNPWLPETTSLAPGRRGPLIDALIGTYKLLPGTETEPFLAALSESTGVERRPVAAESPWITWDMAREMQDAGMVLGGHTVTHPILARLPLDEQEQEIVGCKARFETELGGPMRYFSYPDGHRDAFDSGTKALLRRNGVEYGFSYYGGYSRFEEWDPYDIRRRSVIRNATPQQFRMSLTLPSVYPNW